MRTSVYLQHLVLCQSEINIQNIKILCYMVNLYIYMFNMMRVLSLKMYLHVKSI